MITDVQEQRLLVTSDTHLGGVVSRAGGEVARFLQFAAEGGYNVCINGDGLELMHASPASMTRETFDLFRHLKRVLIGSMRLYYVVGNHDIALERFVNNWGVVNLVPFLNVRSGTQRIHIQHGHLYDPAFMRSPAFYNWATRASGVALRANTSFYNLYTTWRRLRRGGEASDGRALQPTGVDAPFVNAAREVSRRGFDAVVFGHTHAAGTVDLGTGAQYFNTGSWFGQPWFVKIDHGTVTMEPWQVSAR